VALVKATIEVLDRQAVDPARGLRERMQVQFNPGEYTLEKGAQIAEIPIPGIDSPILQFVRGQNERLTLDLFFDTSRSGLDEAATNVRTLTDPFYQLVKQQPKTHAPPRIRFTWGEGLEFKAIVESIRQQFTLFNPAGIPLRATLSVTFREYKTLDEQLSELNLHSSNYTRRRSVRLDDTLARIAAEEYDDPALWRLIADANPAATGNVRRLQPGDLLVIPPRAPAPAGTAAGGGR
jgi:nucleoid-associated protein YgaU